MENVRTHIKTESDRFAFSMAELNRVLSDYDPKTQSFYKPIALPKELNKIDADSRSGYVDAAQAIYAGIGSLLPSTMVSEPRSYPESLLKALICIFRSVVGVEEDIIELLTVAHKAFTQANNPMVVVKSMRSKLLEAKDLHIECKWSQTGAKIVETLCLDNHNMSEGLADFKDITPLDSQVIATLANLFAAIDRQCTKVVKYDNSSKRANSSSVLERLGVRNAEGKTKKDCRDGTACKRSDCYYGHPDGKAIDGNTKTTKPIYDNSNKTGGKCEAMGCPEVKQKKQLCTSCFYKLLNEDIIKTKSKSMSGGEIRKEDLPKHKPRQESTFTKRPRRSAKSVVGVAAIQKAYDNLKRDRSNEDDDTITGKAGPKFAKQARISKDDDDDIDQREARMLEFAQSLSSFGVNIN